jgi:hypothetical protein
VPEEGGRVVLVILMMGMILSMLTMPMRNLLHKNARPFQDRAPVPKRWAQRRKEGSVFSNPMVDGTHFVSAILKVDTC